MGAINSPRRIYYSLFVVLVNFIKSSNCVQWQHRIIGIGMNDVTISRPNLKFICFWVEHKTYLDYRLDKKYP
jgi:hypothetical protein